MLHTLYQFRYVRDSKLVLGLHETEGIGSGSVVSEGRRSCTTCPSVRSEEDGSLQKLDQAELH